MPASANVNQDTRPLPAAQGEAAAVESTPSLPLCWGSKSRAALRESSLARAGSQLQQPKVSRRANLAGSVTEIQADFFEQSVAEPAATRNNGDQTS